MLPAYFNVMVCVSVAMFIQVEPLRTNTTRNGAGDFDIDFDAESSGDVQSDFGSGCLDGDEGCRCFGSLETFCQGITESEPSLFVVLCRRLKLDKVSVAQALSDTLALIAEMPEPSPQEAVILAAIVEQATLEPTISSKTGQGVLEIISILSRMNASLLNQVRASQDVSVNELIQSVEDLGRKLDLQQSSSVRLVANTTALEVWDLTQMTSDDVPIGLQLRTGDEAQGNNLQSDDLFSISESARMAVNETDTAIALPASFIRRIVQDNAGGDVRMWMSVFSETAFFEYGVDTLISADGDDDNVNQSSRSRSRLMNSKVISATITVNGTPVNDFPLDVVTAVFLPFQTVPDAVRAQQSRCVFWDFSGRQGQGAWSEKGCRYSKTLLGRDVCVCDHLTNFALLLDFYGQSHQLGPEHQAALSIISIVGLCLSICGLSCTVLSFIFVKKLHSSRPKQVIFNLTLAMLVSWVIFLAGFTRRHSHAGCLAVAALLHYFILATFLWMLMEGVLQYLLFVKIHGHVFSRFLLKTSLVAWGIPLVPVITILAIDVELYNGYKNYCWMSLTPFYFAFLLPVGLVMLCNAIIYVRVVVSICHHGPNKVSGIRDRAVSIRASVGCFVILGLSWVFAFFAIEDARLVFQYLFTITTSLQGLVIFLFFTLRDPAVKALLAEKFQRVATMVRDRSRSTQSTLASSSKAKVGTESDSPTADTHKPAVGDSENDIPLQAL